MSRTPMHLILVAAFAAFISLLWVALTQAGVRMFIIIGWVAVSAFVFVWIAGATGLVSRRARNIALITALAALLVVILVSQDIIQRVFPHCGDGVCAGQECSHGCEDCSAETCRDGTCQLPIERCDSSQDCGCSFGLVCAAGRNASDARGCAPVMCGDGICDLPNEDRFACCTDCGCQGGHTCERNVCYFQPPRLTFTTDILRQELSATTLAANPMLTDPEGRPYPLVTIHLRNDISQASDVRATFAIQGYTERSIDVGTLDEGAERNISWYLAHDASFIGVTQREPANILVTLEYADIQGIPHTATWSYPFTVLPMETVDEFGNIAFFVTPGVAADGGTPKEVWNGLQKKIAVASDGPIRFPAETLAAGRGSPRDIALLLASVLVRDHKTSIVETQHGLLVRVLDADRFVMLDPSLLARPYDDAIVQRPGYAVHEIEEVWRVRNATVLPPK